MAEPDSKISIWPSKKPVHLYEVYFFFICKNGGNDFYLRGFIYFKKVQINQLVHDCIVDAV